MKRAIVSVVNTHRAVPFGGWVTLYPKTRGENRIRGPSGDQLDTSSEGDDEPEFKIGIPGYRAIFGGKRSRPIRQLFWISLTLVLFFLAVVQVGDRIEYYMKTPTRTDLVVISNETLIFPRVTVCHRNTFNYTAMEEMRLEAARALGKKEEEVQMPYDLVSVMNLSALWNIIGNNVSIMAGKECWFTRGKECNKNGAWRQTNTVRGPCYSYDVRNPVRETGIFNGLYMQMEGKTFIRPKLTQVLGTLNQQSNKARTIVETPGNYFDAWTYYVHPANVNPALTFLINDSYEHPSTNVDVQIRFYQMTALNVWRNPCIDDADYTMENCQLKCFSEIIVRFANCCLPFMRLTQTTANYDTCILCNTPDDYQKADVTLQRILNGTTPWNPAACNCTRQCYTTYYKTNIEKVLSDIKSNRFRLRVFFQDKSYEKFTERLVYSLTTLFCDIGSSVGLLLGASVLTVVETLEWGCFSLIRLCHRRLVAGKVIKHKTSVLATNSASAINAAMK